MRRKGTDGGAGDSGARHCRAHRHSRCCRTRGWRSGAAAELQYDRSRDLPPLLALWPWEIEDMTPDGRQRLVARLRRALRLERQRAIAGHWTYDLARHARLLAAYRSEVAILVASQGSAVGQVRPPRDQTR